jgi:YesN/AraC family two-component response regulator
MSENGGIRVSEIAYMVGFQNPNYFGKYFKKTFGKTPTEFLNQ